MKKVLLAVTLLVCGVLLNTPQDTVNLAAFLGGPGPIESVIYASNHGVSDPTVFVDRALQS